MRLTRAVYPRASHTKSRPLVDTDDPKLNWQIGLTLNSETMRMIPRIVAAHTQETIECLSDLACHSEIVPVACPCIFRGSSKHILVCDCWVVGIRFGVAQGRLLIK